MKTNNSISTLHWGELKNNLQTFLEVHYKEKKIALLVDENTLKNCLPIIDALQIDALRQCEIIEIEASEHSKSIEVATHLWQTLQELNFNRNDLLINLGGGVVCDLGGFVASCYKRGMNFIHIPTSLLAMVDASLGGKTGINLENAKNQVGTFALANAIFIDPIFLYTLPQRELISGFAEVVKHALISDKNVFEDLKIIDPLNDEMHWLPLIQKAAEIKLHIVEKDFNEIGLRKVLNFGHSIGHAIESWAMHNNIHLLHGEAVAAGMIAEAWLSYTHGSLNKSELKEIELIIDSHFQRLEIPTAALNTVVGYLQNDKKNTSTLPSFSLLKHIGEAIYNQELPLQEAEKALHYYLKIKRL